MCGRYASARKRIELLEEFSVQRDRVTESLEPDYNVAPTKPVYAVLTRRPRAAEAAEQAEAVTPAAGEPQRELRVVRWGLVPSWARDASIGSRLINARSETVSEKPAFKRAFARRRCLLPADGYYEWQQPGTGSGAARSDPAGSGGSATAGSATARSGVAKQPFYICRGDGGSLAFAGLYELWRDRALPDGDPDAWLWTATIITTTAPDDLGRIHDRMPMVIERGSWADWLDPANSDAGDLLALLAPAAADGLASYPVSRAVNSVRNNGPELIEPVELTGPELTGPELSALRPRPSGSGPDTLF
jgi:putative SOS response-associated peptidase YedK